MEITLNDVIKASNTIEGIVNHTPLKLSQTLTEATSKNVWLKLENMQPTGAFKLRGASNAILNLSDADRRKGIITMSTGNHGKAVAYMAKLLNIPAVICVSELVPEVKLKGMRDLGVEVVITGKDQEQADEGSLRLAAERGLTYISAFDDPMVIAGQGTIALEILKERPDTDTIVVPLSGGGLMSGVAMAAKSIKPNINIIGVSMEYGAAMHMSINAGEIVPVDESFSLADALTGCIPTNNRYTFNMCSKYVDSTHLVSEDQIGRAVAHAFCKERLVLEGGACAPIAYVQNNYADIKGNNVAIICSGDNIDINKTINLYNKYYNN
jgi:threonine dehydratase